MGAAFECLFWVHDVILDVDQCAIVTVAAASVLDSLQPVQLVLQWR